MGRVVYMVATCPECGCSITVRGGRLVWHDVWVDGRWAADFEWEVCPGSDSWVKID